MPFVDGCRGRNDLDRPRTNPYRWGTTLIVDRQIEQPYVQVAWLAVNGQRISQTDPPETVLGLRTLSRQEIKVLRTITACLQFFLFSFLLCVCESTGLHTGLALSLAGDHSGKFHACQPHVPLRTLEQAKVNKRYLFRNPELDSVPEAGRDTFNAAKNLLGAASFEAWFIKGCNF